MRILARLLSTLVLFVTAAFLSHSSYAQPCGGFADGSACIEKSTETDIGVKFCSDVESCKSFCSCACTLHLNKWKHPKDTPGGSGNDGATECPGVPQAGKGIAPPDDLTSIPSMQYVKASPGARATVEVVDGLKRLDAYLATSPSRVKYKYTVVVRSCYRPAIDDIEKECNFVLKAMHVLNKDPQDAQKRAEWTPKLNPNNLGLAWPGASPHSSGQACDLVLVDEKGKASFDWRVGTGSPHSSIDQRLASKMLDEAVTNDQVGGRRLNYESWHYEWGTSMGCRCKDPECADKFWPPLGRPNCTRG
jgi:hypothetical protein